MNKVILAGRLTKDPDARTTSSGMEIARFSVAAQGDYVPKSGEREVEFINCVAFGNTAATINKFCKKGSSIMAMGKIKNGSYEAKDGTKRYTTDVIIDSFEFGGTKAQDMSSRNDMPSFNNSTSVIETTDVTEDPYKNFGEEITLSSDDLPF